MATTEGQFVMQFRDYDNEPTKLSVRTAVLTAVNFDAQIVLRDAFIAAVEAVTLGNLISHDTGNVVEQSVAPASVVTAQRELAWKINSLDATAIKAHQHTLPCPKLSLLSANNRAYAKMGDVGTVDNFVARFEAYIRSPAGNALDIQDIKLIGRNL